MHLRPAPAHWFETYVPRKQTVYALDALAATGRVQLELDPRLAEPLVLAAVDEQVRRFEALRARYGGLLPTAGRSPAGHAEAPELIARRAVQVLEDWSAPLQAWLEQRAQRLDERRNLQLLMECLGAMREASRDVDHLAQPVEFLYKGVFACAHEQPAPEDICVGIDESFVGPAHRFFIIVDRPDCRELIEKAYRSRACYRLQIPAWLPRDPGRQPAAVSAHLADTEAALNDVEQRLNEKRNDTRVAAAVADIELLAWYLEQSKQLAVAGRLCHVSGWTTADDVAVLQEVFDREDIHGRIRFAAPPGFSKVPVHMRVSWWARPFLFIVEMLGTPDSTEIDSSKLLPVIVPLLFGYMFPDVGHGFVLVLFSLVMFRRWPAGRFLIPCGVSAMLFGLLFGEVFGRGHLVEPLWLSPLDHPLEVLLAPLLLGIGLIMLGLIFNGAEALWRDQVREWLSGEAALLLLYPAALVGVFVPWALWGVLAALVWFVLGHLLAAVSGRLAHLVAGLGMLLRSVFELAVNTLSFLRVGAFALAHAALTSAVLGIADGITSEVTRAVFLVLGHLFIIAIEGLVVFVQTTRLVLLEFFVRFLRAEGRGFRPTSEPTQR